MEYEKHIKRLVLGYLKTACKSSYRRFLKTHFHSQQKHIATRVAGQTLEDILKVYSRVQDIIQGRLEDTEYYKDNGSEFSSPIYLVEQLTYLLDRDGRFIAEPSVCGRSTRASSVAETYQDTPDHTNDIETTPEYTLPGNIQSSEDNDNYRTPFRRKSPSFKTPYPDSLPITEQDNISSVMSMKLLGKRDFPKKLAQNINTVLNTPQIPSTSRNVSNSSKKQLEEEIEETVKNAVTRIESDPLFDDLLQDFMYPVASSMGKVIPDDNSTQSRSYFRNLMEPEEQNKKTSSSVLNQNNGPMLNNIDSSVSDNVPNKDANRSAQMSKELTDDVMTSEQSDTERSATSDRTLGKTTASQQVISNTTSSGQVGLYPTTFAVNLNNCQNPSSEMCNYPPLISQSGSQQQFYIVNQPLVIPQTMQLIQPVQTVSKPIAIDPDTKILPKSNTNLTEQDIMSMPTIILNERNEITYADPGAVANPLKLGEVHNIKDYFKVFGATDQSPVIKKKSKKSINQIKPTPTIKVEIFKRNEPLMNTENITTESEKTAPIETLPSLNEPINVEQESACAVTQSASSKIKIISDQKIESNTVCTPPPSVATVRKPTPKSSSHIRNLTFPSPLRKTPTEKSAGNHNSPSALNKQQASKDLFKNTSEEENKTAVQQKIPPKEKYKRSSDSKKNGSRKVKSPKKTNSPKKQDSAKKTVKTSKKNEKLEEKTILEHNTFESWDASLRKIVPNEENHSTPVRKATLRKRIKRSTELDVTDPDGKMLENALKTPQKTGKTKGKTPSKKKKTKISKPKPEKKMAEIKEEVEIEQTKMLSPSKLCNTASKRNMEVDSVNPPHNQLVSNARKNITSLLETPLKEEVVPSTEAVLDPANTPFTQMLKANLEGFTVGDTFSIDTPNVPVTPGSSLMERSSAPYCILNDTETNKATDAIVFSEERKSSVRKTDDEDFEVSPKVYGCKEILDDFNKSRAGKKNLELIDNKGVMWDGSSDKEYKTENSESNSDGESNNTVIQSSSRLKTGKKVGNSRTPQKNKTRSQSLEKNVDLCDMSTTSEIIRSKENPDNSEDTKFKSPPSNNKNDPISKKLNDNGSSSDSEIISKENFKVVQVEKNVKNTDEKDNIQEKVLENDANKNIISSSTAESIKSVITVSLKENCTSRMTTTYSLKAEMEEKRKRIIELEKTGASRTPKSCTRRRNSKSQRSNISPSNKRKQSSPTKVVKRAVRNEQADINGSVEKVDSQDEFFKKSGSNLHRTNKQLLLENSSENISSEQEDLENIVDGSSAKNKQETKVDNTEDKLREHVKPSDGQKTNEPNKTTDNVTTNEDDSFWDTCDFQLQPEEIVITYDKKKTSRRRLSEYDLNLEKKVFKMGVPLADGSSEVISVVVTPVKTLWEIMPPNNGQQVASSASVAGITPDCSSDSENTSYKVGDLDTVRNSKKRKQRSDSCNSNSSSKRAKPSNLSTENIQKLLTRLHGPSETT